jgi:hypothetical protein
MSRWPDPIGFRCLGQVTIPYAVTVILTFFGLRAGSEISVFELRERRLECASMLSLNHSTLRTFWLLAIALLGWAPNIQTLEPSTAVPITKEPHHQLVFENVWVRVFRVSIPGHDATLLHQHDLPYVSVSLGPADFVNSVVGKPEVHVVLADGQVGYSRGGFAHIARTDAGVEFNNLTIELLKPQGEPENLCAKIVADAPAGACPELTDKQMVSLGVPQFKTDEMYVQLGSHGATGEIGVNPIWGTLFVIASGSGIQRIIDGRPSEALSAGTVVWLPSGSNTTFHNTSGKPWTSLSLSFKDASPFRKDQQ